MRDSGVYYLQIRGTTYWFLKVYCEQDIAEGGWTVSNLKNFFNACHDVQFNFLKYIIIINHSMIDTFLSIYFLQSFGLEILFNTTLIKNNFH